MHANTLPTGSAFRASQRGGQHYRGWDEDRYMMAQLINVASALQYITLLANLKEDTQKPDAPELFPLPDDREKPKQDKPGSFGSIAKSLLAKAKARKAKEAAAK